MYFQWVKGRSWSGGRVTPSKSERGWGPETKESVNHNPVLFSVKLSPEEEGLTLDQLIAKYPKPGPKS